ncbi:DUF2971 domain-containing protein [Sphingomonas profundi]|uniref:DUF2971 domain-containing protein n=1 Tax=Alterirhizorhabdus profundi TaxID=2681549 RepID=UPI0012E86C4B|nr:DUF2971 domain-containing protein [Sphingomonas profundi]
MAELDPHSDDYAALHYCLFQYAAEAVASLQEPGRFAHYTSAAVVMDIIQSEPLRRSLWLRNATEMNDFSEIEFGLDCLEETLKDQIIGDKFKKAVQQIDERMLNWISSALIAEAPRIKANTYLLSLAQHDIREQRNGILSMWRAYGGDANVCLILKPGPFVTEQTAYDVSLHPVSYGGLRDFRDEFSQMCDRLIERVDDLRAIDPDVVWFNIKRAIDFMVLSTKHPSFIEEKEWRVIYRPPDPPAVPDVPSKIVCVNGIVQKVFYLPMVNIPDQGVNGADLHEVLDRIIIGPTPNPPLVINAFVELLRQAGIEDAARRVVYCDVPLRR